MQIKIYTLKQLHCFKLIVYNKVLICNNNSLQKLRRKIIFVQLNVDNFFFLLLKNQNL